MVIKQCDIGWEVSRISGDGWRAFHTLQCHFKQFKMAKSHGCHMKINKYMIEYFQKKKIMNTI